jgi:hypothetical protein
MINLYDNLPLTLVKKLNLGHIKTHYLEVCQSIAKSSHFRTSSSVTSYGIPHDGVCFPLGLLRLTQKELSLGSVRRGTIFKFRVRVKFMHVCIASEGLFYGLSERIYEVLTIYIATVFFFRNN